MTDKISKFLNSLDSKTKKRLKEKLILIKADPFGVIRVKKLQVWGDNCYRVRVGKIRIVY